MVTAAAETRARRSEKANPRAKPATITAVISEKTKGDSHPPVQQTAATPRATSATHLDQAADGPDVADRLEGPQNAVGDDEDGEDGVGRTTVVVVDGEGDRGDGGAPADGDDPRCEGRHPVDRLHEAEAVRVLAEPSVVSPRVRSRLRRPRRRLGVAAAVVAHGVGAVTSLPLPALVGRPP